LGAITNCAGNKLDLNSGGVAGAIKKDGGDSIEQQCKQWVQ
jgi:O-acetyl-ADP-ribose deacetylase (regulator of RNase III)